MTNLSSASKKFHDLNKSDSYWERQFKQNWQSVYIGNRFSFILTNRIILNQILKLILHIKKNVLQHLNKSKQRSKIYPLIFIFYTILIEEKRN